MTNISKHSPRTSEQCEYALGGGSDERGRSCNHRRSRMVVLSAMMNGADDLPVTADHFGSSPNRMIFNCVSGLNDRCLIAVTDALRLNGELDKVGGASRITEIATLPHDPQNLKYALDQVLEHSKARQLAKIGERMHKGEIGHGEALEQLESLNRHTRRPHIDIGRQGSAVEFPDVVLGKRR